MNNPGMQVDFQRAYAGAVRYSAQLDMVEWTEQKRVLSAKTSAKAGPWQWYRVPFLFEPYYAWSGYDIRELVIVGCTQFGKSTFTENILGYTVDQDPAPILLVLPNENQAKERVQTRFKPMLEDNGWFLDHLGGDINKLNVDRATEFDSCVLFLAWAGSAATLGDRPIGRIIVDEAKDMGLQTGGNQPDAVSLAKNRRRTYFSRSKMLTVSSPTDEHSLINREHEAGDKRDAYAPCRYCCAYQMPIWDNVKLEPMADGDELFWPAYVCPHCQRAWSEGDRVKSVSKIIWMPEGSKVFAETGEFEDLPGAREVALWTHRDEFEIRGSGDDRIIRYKNIRIENPPAKRAKELSWRVPATLLHTEFQTIAGLWDKHEKAQKARAMGETELIQDFKNNELAEIWDEAELKIDEDTLSARQNTYAKGETVPDEVRIITAGADIQADCLYCSIWGWAYGFETWLLDFQRLDTGRTDHLENWAPLTLLFERWDQIHKIDMTLVDYSYRPDDAIAYCKSVGGRWLMAPVQGVGKDDDRIQEKDIVPGRIGGTEDTLKKRRRRKAAAGMPFYKISVGAKYPNNFKDRFSRMVEIERDGPGRVHLPADTTDEFKKQFASEYKHITYKAGRAKKQWRTRTKHAANHYWDTGIYALAAAEIRGVRNIPDPEKVVEKKKIKLSDLRPVR